MDKTKIYQRSLFWFRRDLRLSDNCGLFHALKNSKEVYCVFVFDTAILNQLTNKFDRRVDFIYQSVEELRLRLKALGTNLFVRFGDATVEIPYLIQQLDIDGVFTNHDYEPDAIQRDSKIKYLLNDNFIDFNTYKDHVIFEHQDILNQQNQPFNVFTSYKKKWLSKLLDSHFQSYDIQEYQHKFGKFNENLKIYQDYFPKLDEIGFKSTQLSAVHVVAGESGAINAFNSFQQKIHKYKDLRDFPEVPATSKLSVHLRFGTISIRKLVAFAYSIKDSEGALTWLSELIWREFFIMILANYPHIINSCFQEKFNQVKYLNNEKLFKSWCEGKTGFPIVDAGMRELNSTGFMHNRVRMITASFLVKDLHIDWKWGERYFAEKLLDFDLASNNGGWQWSASTGCDAQPYFRIFNPTTQSEKFDPKGIYIKTYIPELKGLSPKQIHQPYENQADLFLINDYPKPIVNHKESRTYTLEKLFKF